MVKYNFFNEKEYNTKTPTSTKFMCRKKGYPKFDNLRRIYQGTNLYKQIDLSFTGAGLPSLARRARVPTHSATLM